MLLWKKIPTPCSCDFSVKQYSNKRLTSSSIKCKIKYRAAKYFKAFLLCKYNPKTFVFKHQQKGEYRICGI